MSADDLVTVRSYLHRDEAQLARIRLEAVGISAMVFADDEGGLSPGFFTEHRVRLTTRRDDLYAALGELDPDAPRLRVAPEARQAMVEHSRFWAPLEACGLVAIDDPTAQCPAAVMVYCLTNIDRSPLRFTVAPAEHYGALRHAERNGWEIGGAFHSHPKAEPFPSQRDVAGALDPSWFHLIVGPVRNPGVRAYTISRGVISDAVIVD